MQHHCSVKMLPRETTYFSQGPRSNSNFTGAKPSTRLPVNSIPPWATWTVARRGLPDARLGDGTRLRAQASAKINGTCSSSNGRGSNAAGDIQQQAHQLPTELASVLMPVLNVPARVSAAQAAAADSHDGLHEAQAGREATSGCNEFLQPVSLLIIELISPSYAVARMVRLINEDSALTGTSIAAYAAVERNPWTHQYRSPRSASVIGVPEDSYINKLGSICDPAIQLALINNVQHHLEQSAASSGQKCIDGVLVFAAPPTTAYSMPVWHLDDPAMQLAQEAEVLTDLDNRLDAADRIVCSILQVYKSIEAICASVPHPVTKRPVPCSMIMHNDWVDPSVQIGSGYSEGNATYSSSSSTSDNSEINSSSSSSRNGSSNGSVNGEENSSSNEAPQLHTSVVLGLQNRPFIKPYLAGPVTHGPFHLLKHCWCSDGHLSRPVRPSAIFTNLPGLTSNACWCGKCDKRPDEWDDGDIQLLKEHDSRYLIPLTKPLTGPRQAGQHRPRHVWPEAFIVTAVMTFKLYVARQLLAVAGEDTAAAQLVSAAATAAADAHRSARDQLRSANSRPRRSSQRVPNISVRGIDGDISEIYVQQGQTVAERQQQLMGKTVRNWLWPLLDYYEIRFRKKATKPELMDIILQHEEKEGLIVADSTHQ